MTRKSPVTKVEGVTLTLDKVFSVIDIFEELVQSSMVFPFGVRLFTVIKLVNGRVDVGFYM